MLFFIQFFTQFTFFVRMTAYNKSNLFSRKNRVNSCRNTNKAFWTKCLKKAFEFIWSYAVKKSTLLFTWKSLMGSPRTILPMNSPASFGSHRMQRPSLGVKFSILKNLINWRETWREGKRGLQLKHKGLK